jgi:hypothetical protein
MGEARLTQGLGKRRRGVMSALAQEMVRIATRSAYKRCARVVCYGCGKGWEHTDDKRGHQVPGSAMLVECSAYKIHKLLL